MTTEKKSKKAKTEYVPTPNLASSVSEEQETWSPGDPQTVYVVVRHTYGLDLRVSDKEYKNKDDERAILERDFWNRVIKFHPDGTSTEIVKYDKKKHRIW